MDFKKDDSWVGNQPKVRVRNITRDFETLELARKEVLFVSNFYMSNLRVEHSRIVYNILQLFSSVGGMLAILKSYFKLVVLFINRRYITAKFIRSIYFVDNCALNKPVSKLHDLDHDYNTLQSMKFGFKDKMAKWKQLFCGNWRTYGKTEQ